MLTGKRVTLRPVRRSDLANFVRWFNDPEVIQYLAMYLPLTEMAEEKWLEERAPTDVHLVIEAIEGNAGRAIGNVALTGVNPKDHHAMFGIAIGEKDHWSQGYGTEAARLIVNYGFEQLNLHRINSSAFDFNERNLRLHRAVGFTEEGRQRECDYKNGRFHDRVLFGLLRDEWKGL